MRLWHSIVCEDSSVVFYAAHPSYRVAGVNPSQHRARDAEANNSPLNYTNQSWRGFWRGVFRPERSSSKLESSVTERRCITVGKRGAVVTQLLIYSCVFECESNI